MERFTQNDVLAYFYGEVISLFSAGSPTATVFTDRKQRSSVAYSSIHGEIILDNPFEGPITNVICGTGIWAGDKSLRISAIILADSRSVAEAIRERLEDFLKTGQFQDTSLTPPAGPSVLMYTEYRSSRKYHVESELYGIQVEFDVYFYRV